MTQGVEAELLGVQDQIGLCLPDGTMVWPPDELQGRPLVTEGDREQIVEALRATAADLHIPEQEFVGRYQWVPRRRIVVSLNQTGLPYPVTLPEPSPAPSTDRGTVPEGDRHGL